MSPFRRNYGLPCLRCPASGSACWCVVRRAPFWCPVVWGVAGMPISAAKYSLLLCHICTLPGVFAVLLQFGLTSRNTCRLCFGCSTPLCWSESFLGAPSASLAFYRPLDIASGCCRSSGTMASPVSWPSCVPPASGCCRSSGTMASPVSWPSCVPPASGYPRTPIPCSRNIGSPDKKMRCSKPPSRKTYRERELGGLCEVWPSEPCKTFGNSFSRRCPARPPLTTRIDHGLSSSWVYLSHLNVYIGGSFRNQLVSRWGVPAPGPPGLWGPI